MRLRLRVCGLQAVAPVKRKLPNRQQKYMERNISRAGLGEAAARALANYRRSGLVMPGDDMIRLVEWRVHLQKWAGEAERIRP